MTISSDQARALNAGDGDVRSSTGDKIGSIGHIYLDNGTAAPTWVLVKTGLLGTRRTVVPLSGARVEGDDLVVDVTVETVRQAPRFASDDTLAPEQEEELYRHYGLGGSSADQGDADQGDVVQMGPADLGPPAPDAHQTSTDGGGNVDYEGTNAGPLSAISGGKPATDAGAVAGRGDADRGIGLDRDESYAQGRVPGMFGNPDVTEGVRRGAAEPAMAGGGTEETAGTGRDTEDPGSVGRDYEDSTPAHAGMGGSDSLTSTSPDGSAAEADAQASKSPTRDTPDPHTTA